MRRLNARTAFRGLVCPAAEGFPGTEEGPPRTGVEIRAKLGSTIALASSMARRTPCSSMQPASETRPYGI